MSMLDKTAADAQPFFLGTFASNCSGGMTVTKVPERWVSSWDNNLRLAQLLDEAGIDFMLPIYFMCLVMGFRARANWLPVVAASAVCSTVGYHIAGSPWHVTIGAAAGILVAALLAKPVEPR